MRGVPSGLLAPQQDVRLTRLHVRPLGSMTVWRLRERRRMGHSSPRAALIYLHATRERDERIAAGMGKLLKDARRARKTGTTAKGSGTQRARGKGRAS
jgi:hypothetical protein